MLLVLYIGPTRTALNGRAAAGFVPYQYDRLAIELDVVTGNEGLSAVP